MGGAIGQAIVKLELDTSKYSAELKGAQAETVAGANTMGSGLSRFSGLASTALLGAGAAAVAFGAFSVKAAIEANEAHLKLQNTFDNNAKLADSSVEAFERQAGALRDLTGVDDEAIISGQALLGQMNRTGQEVTDLTPLVVDLAEKYDIDLQAAFKAVGKAADGSTGALARYVGQIKEGNTPAETFQNVLDALGKSAGFAAERAKDEPWRILKQQFEEIAERLGTALLPILQDLAEFVTNYVLPFLEGLIIGFQQLGHWVGVAIDWIGRFYDKIGSGVPVTNEMVDLIAKSAAPELAKLGDQARETGGEFQGAQVKIQRFADMSWKDLHEWESKTKGALRDATFSLDGLGEQSEVTAQDFRDAQHQMFQDARELGRAMKELSNEDWINQDYVKFLVDQGPAAVVGFAELNDRQQRRMSERWTASSDDFNRTIRRSFDDMGHILDDLDNKTTKHTVEVHYKYVDFDPTKPGMQHAGARPG